MNPTGSRSDGNGAFGDARGEDDASSPVSAAQWERIADVLQSALDRPTRERPEFLERACADDTAVRREVETLLEAHGRSGPLDRPADELVAPLLTELPLSLPGHRVSHYEIGEKLGGGGMGVVYRARDLRLGRAVALKFLPPQLGGDGPAKERFLLEARAAAALDHPNICTIHEIGETEAGHLFLAMPYYDGETLDQRIARGPLPVEDALAIAVQVADGLERAHEQGIVHRDIKPANLIVNRDGVVKILDFGIAKRADVRLTRPGSNPGTIAYMSPEQAEGREVDHRSDLWSLGVVLYEMLTGDRPFQGANDREILRAMLTTVPPLRGRQPEVPEALARAVRRALAVRVDDRYPTAGELARDIRAVAAKGRSTASSEVFPAEPEQPDELATPERRQVVIVVTTLSGYPALVERLVPDELDRVVARIHAAATRIVARHGGTVNRVDAEEMIFLFGVPAAHEDDGARAIRAALELHAEVRDNSRDVERLAGRPIALHSGIDAGRVIVQPPPEGEHAYRIAGSAVRIAARLSAQAPADEVWLSPHAHRLTGPFFETEPRSELDVPGRDHPLVPQRVTRESGLRSRLEAARQVGLTAFTGRDSELAALNRAMDEAVAGEGQLVAVMGDAGIGKSRLLYEFRQALDPARVLVLQGRCQSYGNSVAYLPFVEMLEERLDLGETSPGAAVAKAVERLREIGPELEEFIPLYLQLLSVASDEYPVPKHLHGDQFRLAMQEALAAFFTLDSRDRAGVLLLEDWHWADPASRELLTQIVEMAPGYPLLVVVTYRPGHGVGWEAQSHVTPLALRPLEVASSLAIMRSAIQVERFPEPLGSLLHERTGGNPFFLEEICQTLLEDGTIRVDGDTAVLRSSLHALELPDTVQAVIRARLDRLDREARELLRLAAVVGREFSRGILELTLPEGIRSGTALERLKAAGLIQQRQVVPEPAYRFKHVLTQEVAYSSLLEHQRRELHARVGGALEQLGGETGNTQFDRLAHHFSRAGEWEKAVHYGVRSAERDESLAQFSEALRLLERTQRWLRQLPEGATRHGQLVEILLRQERLCETLGLRGRQQRIIDELLLLLDADADGPKLAEVQVRQGDLFTLLRRFDAAEQAIDRALAAYRAMGDAVGERNTLRSLGLLRWHQGRNEEALGAIEQALEIDRQRGTVEAIVGDLSNLASVLKSMGEFDRARVQLEEALHLSERGDTGGAAARPDADLHVKRAYILHHLANVYRELGDNAAALEHLHRAVVVSREKRLPIQASFHYTAIAHILLQESRIEDSLRYYREAVDLTRRARFVPGLSQALRILGEVLLGLGRRDEALPPLLEAAGLFGQLKDRATEALIWSSVATIHERDARLAEALAAWGKARALYRKEKHAAGEMAALEGLARVTRRHVAEPSLALEYLREALALARRSVDPSSEGRLRNTIGILEWGQGNYREALRHYTRALEDYRQLGDDVSAGLMLNSIGVTLQALGRWNDACRSLTEAIELHRRTAQRQLEAHALGALGDVRCELGEIAQATEAFEHSLRIRTEIGDRRGEGWMLHHLAKAHLLLGEAEAAYGRLERSERLADELDDSELAAACAELRSTPPF